MIVAYTGRNGSGKTYSMVRAALKFEGRRRIYSNMDVDWSTRLNRWQDLLELRSGLVLIDEIGSWFSSRKFRDMPDEIMSFFQQHRKHKLDLYYTVQSPTMCDAFVRKLTGEWYTHERWGPFIRERGLDPDSGERFSSVWYRLNPAIFERYDTFEVIGDKDGKGYQREVVGDDSPVDERSRRAALVAARCVRRVDDLPDWPRVRYVHATVDDVLSGCPLVELRGGPFVEPESCVVSRGLALPVEPSPGELVDIHIRGTVVQGGS